MDREEALQTREQRFAARRRDAMYVSKTLFNSPAWWSLGATACKVYMIFLTKRQMSEIKVPGKPGKREKEWVVRNNGEITFTYTEAKERYGIKPSRFVRAIDGLVRAGLIDIAHSGVGLHKDVTLYAISDRWKLYGTPEFVKAERPKRGIKLGFKKGNTYGCRCRRQDGLSRRASLTEGRVRSPVPSPSLPGVEHL
jgi:hypothetical protein